MSADTNAITVTKNPKAMTIVGWVLGGLPCGLLLMSAAMKLVKAKGLEEGMGHLGWPVGHATALGVLELACTLLYLIPRTMVLGAVLLTGYMGGAIATHVRVGDAFIAQVLVGVALWLGVFLRDGRVRAILPVVRAR